MANVFLEAASLSKSFLDAKRIPFQALDGISLGVA
jgi:hypothetical protein